jgi:beta-lactamase superfamily II metal-dependent hydrolase
MAEETLIPFFKKKEIYKLDYLITTHDDFDHSGAATSLIANFRVEQTIDKATSFRFRSAISSSKIQQHLWE